LNKRHYQILALLILIGAPLLVSALASLLPKEQAAPGTDPSASGRPEYLQPAVDPIAELDVKALPDPPPTPQNYGPPAYLTGNATLDPTPTLDPSSGAVAGVDPVMPQQIEPSTPEAAAPQPALGGSALKQEYAPPPAYARPPFREGPLVPGR
jgi:hypothetical protein